HASVLVVALCVSRPPHRATLFPTRRSSDLEAREELGRAGVDEIVADIAGHFVVINRLALGEAEHGSEQRVRQQAFFPGVGPARPDRKSTRLNSSHVEISYAVFLLKKTNIYH